MDAGAFRKLGRFATVGVAATAAYAVFAWLLTRVGGLPPLSSSVIAYAAAAVLSYAGHRRVTFRSDRAHAVALPQFLALNAIGAAIAAGLTAAGEALRLPVEAALAATCVAMPLLNFLVLDRVVFAGRAAHHGPSA